MREIKEKAAICGKSGLGDQICQDFPYKNSFTRAGVISTSSYSVDDIRESFSLKFLAERRVLMKDSTANFLRLMNERNAAIAALEAAKEAAIPDFDPIRLEREEERRAKYGQLRAREKPSHRQKRVRHLYGHPYGYTNHTD
jgi:hypothetical protein